MKHWYVFFILLIGIKGLGQAEKLEDDGRKIMIPVVFHIVYDSEKDNIEQNLILNELADLNLDFSAKNDMGMLDSEFRSIVGNPNIEFYLIDKVFAEADGKGIQRIPRKNIKNLNDLLIDPQNCVNIFISRDGNSSDILSDRINLNCEDVGLNSHVLTHETGHWLGLFHVFGQIGNSKFYNVWFGNHDDLIEDTPKQIRASAVCYEITPDCPCPPRNIYYKKHKTLFNNFMDYNPCRCMFTLGQAKKIRDNIIEHKPALYR
ncbi:M43 family zinc metalloprotease [Flavobacterium sp.]|uniref:M43 family zinc metalloprotease n=1 Tax=Flavobacterium sp. TaxID=239 RepID=UPI0031CE2A83